MIVCRSFYPIWLEGKRNIDINGLKMEKYKRRPSSQQKENSDRNFTTRRESLWTLRWSRAGRPRIHSELYNPDFELKPASVKQTYPSYNFSVELGHQVSLKREKEVKYYYYY